MTEASYFTDGCPSSSICGSFAAQLAIGKDPDEFLEISPDTIFETITGKKRFGRPFVLS